MEAGYEMKGWNCQLYFWGPQEGGRKKKRYQRSRRRRVQQDTLCDHWTCREKKCTVPVP